MATLTYAQLQQYAQNAGFDPANAAIAAAIALAESGGNTLAHNPGTAAVPENSYGVFQLNLLAHPDISLAQASDPQQAANKAYQLWKQAGGTFADWTTFTRGTYQQFLPPGWGSGNPISGIITGAGNAAGTATSSAVIGFLSNIPVLKNFLTAPADLGTRLVGTGVGLVIIVIGLVSVATTTNRKILNSALGQGAVQGAAQGASGAIAADALTDGAAAPVATVREEAPAPQAQLPARNYRPFAQRGTRPRRPSPDEPVEGQAREVDAKQLRPGHKERVRRAAREIFPEKYDYKGEPRK